MGALLVRGARSNPVRKNREVAGPNYDGNGLENHPGRTDLVQQNTEGRKTRALPEVKGLLE
jgi:hypothetical protein